MANKIGCGFKKQLNSRNLECPTKCMLYKSHIRPINTNGSEFLPLSKMDGNIFRIFERRILRMIYGLINGNCMGERVILMSFTRCGMIWT